MIELSLQPPDDTYQSTYPVTQLFSSPIASLDPVPYISNLAVDSSSRRLGVARELIFSAECIAKKSGHDKIRLHVDRGGAADSLYEVMPSINSKYITVHSLYLLAEV